MISSTVSGASTYLQTGDISKSLQTAGVTYAVASVNPLPGFSNAVTSTFATDMILTQEVSISNLTSDAASYLLMAPFKKIPGIGSEMMSEVASESTNYLTNETVDRWNSIIDTGLSCDAP